MGVVSSSKPAVSKRSSIMLTFCELIVPVGCMVECFYVTNYGVILNCHHFHKREYAAGRWSRAAI